MEPTQNEFMKLLADYQAIIHKVNLLYFKSAADQQDNFQEVVYQLWKSFPTVKNKEKPASWIYAVAINTSISKIRKDSKIAFYGSIADLADRMENEPEPENANYQKLLSALQGLSEVDKSIMLLYMEDYSYEEIAAIIGISVSNVGTKIHRLKSQLQKQLKGEDNGR